MRKCLFGLAVLLAAGTTFAGQYFLNWANYQYMVTSSDVTRGLVYSPKTDHIIVATRKGTTQIVILNPATGDSIGALKTTGITGGTYEINLIDVDGDGRIYVCNLSAPLYTTGSTFRIYRWDNEDAEPVVIFDNALDGIRYGDSFAVSGSGNDVWIYSSGYLSDKMVVLKSDALGAFQVDHIITLPCPDGARQGISPVTPGGNIWIDGAGSANPLTRLITNNGTLIASVPDTIFATGASVVRHLNLGEYNLLFVMNGFFTNAIKAARYFEDELGTVTFDYFGDNSDSLMLAYQGNTMASNTNCSGALSYDSKRHSMIVLTGVNAIASVNLDSLLKIRTSRETGVTAVAIDGNNQEYFYYDKVGTSNGHDLYSTWGPNIVFFGVTGHTLFDQTLTNKLYCVFDLDPTGANGSATPPETAGGVTNFPFKADVVVQLDSWNVAEWTTGKVYKWNGSSWANTTIEGFDINYGAMCVVNEGDSGLTEIGVARNTKGLGTAFSAVNMMLYVAEDKTGGNVLCAFPDGNPVGHGVTFTQYFYADSLGTGMLPNDTKDLQIKGEGSAVRKSPAIVEDFHLEQNYPNPFNPTTQIGFSLSHPAAVHIEVFDLKGCCVKTIGNSYRSAGKYTVKFDGAGLSAGVYFYRLIADGKTLATHKMMLLK
ncbi:MAG: DUF4623 domain-containing protein [Candidatus Marinimicrobia bacterium]|nr:DUF4623 domain-containing protein [Candidatus Neomarinimicrobiota bacterium]